MKSKLVRRRPAPWLGAVLAALLSASCGGGTQVSEFVPNRVIALGDESSVIDDSNHDGNGRKYTVNGTVSTTDASLDCRQNPLWIQVLAGSFGLVFPQCNPQPNPVPSPTSRIRATAGARAADIAAQIDAQISESAFTPTDLVPVLAGQNDILTQYAQYPGVSEAQLTANLQAAGTALGVQINRVATLGAKVVVSTVPNMGVTPFAVSEQAAHTDIDRAALLARLTKAFNDKMRAQIINDGRMIGLILTDEYFVSVQGIENGGGFTNPLTAVCDLSQSSLTPPSILDCTDRTLIIGGSATTFLWADATHLSAGGQAQLGDLAVARARDNPF